MGLLFFFPFRSFTDIWDCFFFFFFFFAVGVKGVKGGRERDCLSTFGEFFAMGSLRFPQEGEIPKVAEKKNCGETTQ